MQPPDHLGIFHVRIPVSGYIPQFHKLIKESTLLVVFSYILNKVVNFMYLSLFSCYLKLRHIKNSSTLIFNWTFLELLQLPQFTSQNIWPTLSLTAPPYTGNCSLRSWLFCGRSLKKMEDPTMIYFFHQAFSSLIRILFYICAHQGLLLKTHTRRSAAVASRGNKTPRA